VQSDLDRVRAGVEQLGRFLGVELLDVAQDQDFTVGVGQPLDRASYHRANLRALEKLVARAVPPGDRREPGAALVELRQQLVERLFRLATPAAQLHERGVDDYTMEPGREP
jgi:hypothetical protein